MTVLGEWSRRPAVTWGNILGWTRDNEVPGTAVVRDDWGRLVTEVYRADGKLWAVCAAGKPPITLDQLRTAAEAAGVQEDTPVHLDGQNFVNDARVLDLSGEGAAGPDDDGVHYFTLQRRWG